MRLEVVMIIVVFLLCLLQQVPAFLPPLSSQKTHATPSPSPASYSRINGKYKSAYSSSINLISKTLLRAGREAMQEEDDFEVDEEELVRRLNEEIQRESGVELEQLINPSKVVNLERELIKLRRGLQTQSLSVGEREKMEKKVTEKQNKLNIEKRAVMRGWLKNLFVTQSVIAGVLSLGMVYDLYPNTHLPLSVQVLGFWMWWLFIIPSLRARKPMAQEKEALNIAFLANPVASLIMPTITKDVAIIWWVNAATMALCYAYAYTKTPTAEEEVEAVDDSKEEGVGKVLLKALKALDYGSGQERGLRK